MKFDGKTEVDFDFRKWLHDEVLENALTKAFPHFQALQEEKEKTKS